MLKPKISFMTFVVKDFGFSLNMTLSNYSATLNYVAARRSWCPWHHPPGQVCGASVDGKSKCPPHNDMAERLRMGRIFTKEKNRVYLHFLSNTCPSKKHRDNAASGANIRVKNFLTLEKPC